MMRCDQTMTVAVVVTRNRSDDLRKVILALKIQSRSLDQIIVLDIVCEVPFATALCLSLVHPCSVESHRIFPVS